MRIRVNHRKYKEKKKFLSTLVLIFDIKSYFLKKDDMIISALFREKKEPY